MKIIASVLIFSLLSSHFAYAVGGKYSLGYNGQNSFDQGQGEVSEFVFQRDQNDILIRVYLLGAVNKPGLYHIPANTDLFSLLALAGGTIKEAEVQHIQIKHRPADKEPQTNEVDLDKAITSKELAPKLALNDVVMIPTKEPSVSNNTVATISVVATVIGIVLTGLLVNQALKK